WLIENAKKFVVYRFPADRASRHIPVSWLDPLEPEVVVSSVPSRAPLDEYCKITPVCGLNVSCPKSNWPFTRGTASARPMPGASVPERSAASAIATHAARQ